MTVKHRSNLGGSEGETEVPRLRGMHSVHGKTTGLIGGFGEEEGLQSHGRKIVMRPHTSAGPNSQTRGTKKKRADDGSL